MQNISKWHVLVGGFLAYLFDAMEIILLTIALPVIQQDLGLSIGHHRLVLGQFWPAQGAFTLAGELRRTDHGRGVHP
jgi:hypothetical protein